ncbi:MAG: CHAD domain-containing protein, partial [Zoogloea sp.]|nr:CHAD domain-containing protein [Zoogloea sp.]
TLKPDALHALRIALKRLRYSLEFLAPLLPPRATQRYRTELAAAQDGLGYANDVSVARGIFAGWIDDDVETACGIAFVVGWHASRLDNRRAAMLRQLAPLLHSKGPWRD